MSGTITVYVDMGGPVKEFRFPGDTSYAWDDRDGDPYAIVALRIGKSEFPAHTVRGLVHSADLYRVEDDPPMTLDDVPGAYGGEEPRVRPGDFQSSF